MVQLSNECFAFGDNMISLEDAHSLLRQKLTPIVETETIDIYSALGCVLAEDIGSGSGTEIAVIAGSTVGGVIGYYSTVKLGEHNGFQYTISIDGEKKPIGVIQGIDEQKDYNFKIGDRVTVVYGEKARVLPSNN